MQRAHTIESVRRDIKQALSKAGIQDARLEADLIVEYVTGHGRAGQILASAEIISKEHQVQFDNILSRRLNHEPLDNIFGYREFYGLKLKVSPDVLSPRSETELLIDYVLEGTNENQSCDVLDLGTGSAAIPIAIGANRKNFRIVAADISPAALVIARENVMIHTLEKQILCIQSDWFSNIKGRFDFIISNPPYIKTAIISGLSPEVRNFDPKLALDGGDDGLDPYRIIAEYAQSHLKPNGSLVLEIGYEQGLSVSQILKQSGAIKVEVKTDLSGLDRRVIATY